MDHQTLLDEVYSSLRLNGTWPLLRELQRKFGASVNVRALAAEIGLSLIVCEQNQTARVFLTRKGFERVSDAAEDLELLAKSLAFIAGEYATHGACDVESRALAEALSLSEAQLSRLGALLRVTNGPWNGGSYMPDDMKVFSYPANETVVFFEGVKSYEDVLQVWKRLSVDEDRIRSASIAGYVDVARSPVGPRITGTATATTHRLRDARLQEVFERDLLELELVHSVGAWKAATLLAGSCMEAVLLDLAKGHSEAVQKQLGDRNWPRNAGAEKLLRVCTNLGLIRRDHRDLGSVIRSWRDLIHPAAALASTPPSRELADALIANLRWLLADLAERRFESGATRDDNTREPSESTID